MRCYSAVTELPDHSQIEGRGWALVALVEAVLPVALEVNGDSDAWPLLGASLTSQATSLMKSILDLVPSRRRSSADVLLRSLYKHCVHLAWLAAEPSAARIGAWRKNDLVSRLKADREWRQRGEALLDDAFRADLERAVDQLDGDRLNLAELAVEADRAWTGKLPGMTGGAKTQARSFRGQYAAIYRYTSTSAHPSFTGVNRVIEATSEVGRLVHLEESTSGGAWDPFATATVVYALCLFVAGASLGWPSSDEVDAIYRGTERR
jgi:Family of unknown function (DUF5677)